MTSKPYHHGDLRNSLIEAGIELINQEGAKQFSLRKVSRLCGVSQAAPYSHFQSKEDLLEAMQAHVVKQFMEILENAIKSCANPNDPSTLVQIGKSYVMFFINNPQYFYFLFSQPCMEVNLSLDGDGSSNFPPFEFLKTVALPIFRGMGMTKLKMEDAIISLWATVHGLASIATMKNVHYDKAWEEKIEDIIWNK
ncbi:TetR/AcrR family transcriptional regulator [Serpentinicella alkaliphila]|uniref:TetR family transcriptional regulator n=1 Tax=Serpentinicella alkaliphila TaxID=1734049 RepID=A0A4R2T4T8_9FIRM|nr:TetR/AcrR family transcriptional regulator [Serpentinicella alkaliphila]QUH25800.1 TetR/AcrR family transcriptional regulator [Serpentinicella alkaliphila]TCP95844.1 TetR family transcriptional regulator [Serpentinicella alkaliphila]